MQQMFPFFPVPLWADTLPSPLILGTHDWGTCFGQWLMVGHDAASAFVQGALPCCASAITMKRTYSR